MRCGIQQIKDTPDIFSLRKSYQKFCKGNLHIFLDTLKIINHPVSAVISAVLPD
jgi:hypothetical protein